MRPMLLLCALALAACDDDTTAAAPPDLAAPDLAHSVGICTGTCTPSCSGGTTCVSSSGSTPFSATCLVTCGSDADCGARDCVDIIGASPAGRYCIDTSEPLSCGIHCDLVDRVSRCDGDNVVTEYRSGVVCGMQYHHCANGCVEADPDGGNLRQASCR